MKNAESRGRLCPAMRENHAFPRATSMRHQCDIKATPMRVDSQAVATPKPPSCDLKATPMRPQSLVKAGQIANRPQNEPPVREDEHVEP